MRWLWVAAAVDPGREWVGRARLRHVESVDCLQRLQRDPHDRCAPRPKKVDAEPVEGAWSIGNFPKPLVPELHGGDPSCGAHGELLCDPDHIMTEADQKKVGLSLQMFRENMMVPCRLPWLRARSQHHGASTPRAEDEHQFRVGIALMNSLPTSSLDEESLEVFGEYLLSTWEVSPHDCSAGAVLIVVARAERSWLVAPSCQYACGSDMETGGRVLNVLETSLGWRATSKGRALTSADFRAGIQGALHELEDVMHAQRGMAFANGQAVITPDPDVLWRTRKEREWVDVAPWIEGFTILAVLGLFGYMAHWYTLHFFGAHIEGFRVALKSLHRTG